MLLLQAQLKPEAERVNRPKKVREHGLPQRGEASHAPLTGEMLRDQEVRRSEVYWVGGEVHMSVKLLQMVSGKVDGKLS